jgi:hypothetical protein
MDRYLLVTEGGKWPFPEPPSCPGCGGPSVGWGWTKCEIYIPRPFCKRPIVRSIPIKRFLCCGTCNKSAGQKYKTWSYIPAFTLRLKRYAARVVQGCCDDWVGGASCEAAAEAWHIHSVRTVQRWLRQLTANASTLEAVIRQLLGGKEVQQGIKPPRAPPIDRKRSPLPRNRAAREAVARMFTMIRELVSQLRSSFLDSSRVPYHFVMRVASTL